MRRANFAAMGASLILAGCANAWLPFPSPPSATFAHSAGPAAVECPAKASLPFGSANTTSLRLLIEQPANSNPAAQACTWEKGTRVTYGSGPINTGALPERN